MKEKTNKIRAVSQQEHSRWTSWEAVMRTRMVDAPSKAVHHYQGYVGGLEESYHLAAHFLEGSSNIGLL